MKKVNKKLSIGTSLVSFTLGVIWIIKLIVSDVIPSREQSIAIVIILLGLNAVSFGSDLRGFIKIIKGVKDNEDDK